MLPYREDLAHIHDSGHGDFARQSAPGIIGALRKRGIDSGLVVDLGCGSGIFAAELLTAGYDVLGIDISPAMLDIARKRAPDARFACASFLDVELPPCSAAVAMGEVLGYRFDRRNGLASLTTLFSRVFRSLRTGGVLVFDFLEPGVVKESDPILRFRLAEDWAVLVELSEDYATDRLTRQITSFRRVGDLYRRDDETHEVQLFRPVCLERILRDIGFRVTRLRGYGNYRFRPSHVGLLARKPK
jgi:SAM-dependent methyltransferase